MALDPPQWTVMPHDTKQSTVEGQASPQAERPLNATAASLLGFLHAGPLTGWDLVSTAELVIGDFWKLTRSQVYRELTAMADAGLITAGATGPRERRPYELTDAGRRAFQHWLHTEPGPEQIRYPLLLTLSFGAHLEPELLAGFVAAHRERHEERLAVYRAARAAATEAATEAGADPDPYALATLDFGIRYEQAVLDWFDALPPEIAGAP
jgi:DNA-binding PadR family transcriptional regulator